MCKSISLTNAHEEGQPHFLHGEIPQAGTNRRVLQHTRRARGTLQKWVRSIVEQGHLQKWVRRMGTEASGALMLCQAVVTETEFTTCAFHNVASAEEGTTSLAHVVSVRGALRMERTHGLAM